MSQGRALSAAYGVQSSGEYVQELKNVSAIKLISATPRPTPTNFLNGMYECPPGNFSK